MKQIFFVRSVLVMLFVSLVFTAAGCGQNTGSRQAPVTLTIWKPFVDSGRMQSLFSAYQKQHPNVQFQYVKKNIDTYESDLLNALAAGNGPDIFSINNTWLPQYMDKVTPAPSTVFTYKDYRDTFVDVVSQDFTKNNQIYGTALWVDSLALYYNKDLLGTVGIATPPLTWNDLAIDVRKLTRQDQTGYFSRSGLAAGTNANVNRAVDIVYLYMLQAGAVPWSADGLTPRFASQITDGGKSRNPGVEATSFYTSFSDPSRANYTWNTQSDYSVDAFANGRAAMLYGYSYTRGQILAKAPNLNFDVALAPQYSSDGPSVNFANYFGEVVNKQSKQQLEAWNFLKFATSKESLDAYYAVDKQPSSRRDLIELQQQDPAIGVFAKANLTAKSFYKPNEAKMDGIIGAMIDAVVLKGFTVDQAVGQAQSQASVLGQSGR
jgi:multiple sugar transport system substrate-binding protein